MKKCVLVGAILCLVPIGTARASETTTYTYDALGRLILSNTQGGPNHNVVTVNTLDPAGNRNNYGVSLTGLCQIAANDGGGFNDEFTAYVQVQANGTCPGPVTVTYSTQNGTAIAGTHYYQASGSITLQPGDPYKMIAISPIFGSIPSGQSRVFYVNIAIQSGAATLSDSQSEVSIWSSF